MSKRRTPPDARTGKRNCLKCNKQFMSEDMARNRLCPKCNRDNLNVFLPTSGASTVYTSGGSYSVSSDE